MRRKTKKVLLFTVYEPASRAENSIRTNTYVFIYYIRTSCTTVYPCPAASCARYIRGRTVVREKIIRLSNSTYSHHSKKTPCLHYTTPSSNHQSDCICHFLTRKITMSFYIFWMFILVLSCPPNFIFIVPDHKGRLLPASLRVGSLSS